MPKTDFEKTLDKIRKSEEKIEKTEAVIAKTLSDQLKLDKKLQSAIETQNQINQDILQQLSALHATSKDESLQQHKRFKIELAVSVPAAIAGAVAAVASAVSVYLMIA